MYAMLKPSDTMKFSGLTFISLIFFLTHCKSPSDQIKDAFNTVDKSLGKSNDVLSSSIDSMYSAINNNRSQNEQLAMKADSIYLDTKKANEYMDSLKETMRLQDSTGNRLDVATKLLVGTNNQHELKKYLAQVYSAANRYKSDNTNMLKLDSALLPLKEVQTDREWAKKYFESTPTVAATTMLSKFQNDCTNVAAIILGDIKQRVEQ
ncbi:MAG: hypothetical protein EOO10_20825 [Chitinophagaceae bacterium]|nr:MAG: hypothetical protein EOO10_20825 [Chitinophagaceae bacterium]